MMTKTAGLSSQARRYLSQLRRELGDYDIDAATRANLLTDIEDSLIGLDNEAVAERTATLGSPQQIALTAAEDRPVQQPTVVLPTLGERMCIALAVVAGLMLVLHPLLGITLSVIAGAWAMIARNPTTRRRSYRLALWCALAALVLNVAVLAAGIAVTPAEPTEPTVVQID